MGQKGRGVPCMSTGSGISSEQAYFTTPWEDIRGSHHVTQKVISQYLDQMRYESNAPYITAII
jgi:hypothetical protein